MSLCADLGGFLFALRVLPDGHDERPMLLAALGNGLWMRYERYGEGADINQAIEAGRESVASAAPAERAGHLSELIMSNEPIRDALSAAGYEFV